MEWQVFLTGDESDLNELSKSFCCPDLVIARGEDGFVLRWSRLRDLNEVDAVRREAESVLVLLNGAARLLLHSTLPIAIGRIVLVRDDGSKGSFVSVSGTIRARARASATATVKRADGVEERFNEADPVAEWVKAGLGNEAIARVLKLLATKPLDWKNLYPILEVVESDMGGLKPIAQQGWATRAALKRFKHTANSVFAIGDEARHGTEPTQPPADPMTLSEARSFIETILHNWLRTKQNP